MDIKTDGKVFHDSMSLNINGVYPWQYKDYNINQVTLLPIESDIDAYWNEGSLFRKGYRVDDKNKTIYIPHFFLKINGKHKSKKDYIKFVRFLKETKNTCVFPEEFKYEKFTHKELENIKLQYNAIKKNKENANEIILKIYDEYKDCNLTINNIVREKQIIILEILTKIIENKINEWDFVEFVECIESIFSIPEQITVLINNFDYNFDIPKVIFENYTFCNRTATLVLLLKELAFDIIVLDTGGKTTIEKYVDMPSLSLGFYSDLDIEKESQSKINNIITNIKEYKTYYIHIISFILVFIFNILSLFCFGGIGNTLIEIFSLFVVIVVYMMLQDCKMTIFLSRFISIAIAILIGFILFLRAIIALVNIPVTIKVQTTTYTGTENIADYTLDTKKDYTIKSKKDAVVVQGDNVVRLYIENSQENKKSVYIKIYTEKRKELYISTKIEPFQYIKNIQLESSIYNDQNLTIEYYVYNNTPEKYTDILLGSEEIKLHTTRQNKLEETLEQYKLK